MEGLDNKKISSKNQSGVFEKKISGSYGKKSAIVGFILGCILLVSYLIPFLSVKFSFFTIIFSFVLMPVVGFPLSILGIIFSSVGFKSYYKKWAVFGFIFSLIGFLIVSWIFYINYQVNLQELLAK